MIRSFFIAILAFTFPCIVLASKPSFVGMVKLRTGNKLFVHYDAPKNSGAPIVVLLNGLTSHVADWDPFTAAVEKRDVGVLRFDFMGQGQTLIADRGARVEFTIQAQVADTKALLDYFEVTQPIHVVGFSYGGGIAEFFAAKFPKLIASMTLLAPYTEAIDTADAYLNWQVLQHRLWFPFDVRTNAELYDWYLRIYIYQVFPTLDPRLLDNPSRLEGVFRLTQGIRLFRAADVMKDFPLGKLHLVLGGKDDVVPRKMHDDFWNLLPAAVRASRLILDNVGHHIPETVPVYTAGWVLRIIDEDPALSGGKSYSVTAPN